MPDETKWKGLWAKSEPPHQLWRHLIDVGAVALYLWDKVMSNGWRRHLAALLGLTLAETRNLLVWLAALHDIGKATPQFQFILPAKIGLPDLPGSREKGKLRHGDASAQILLPLLMKHEWEKAIAVQAACATGGHHGCPPERHTIEREEWAMLAGRSSGTDPSLPWHEAQSALIAAVEQALELSAPCPPRSEMSRTALAFLDIAGFISFADWIGSSETHFSGRVNENEEDPAVYATKAKQHAADALRQFGWRALTALPQPADYPALFPPRDGKPFAPRPLQARVKEILDERPRTRFLLVEAPTGEGKTEAALYAAAHWLREYDQRGVYLALPTQATSNAMHARFVDWFERLNVGSNDVLLLHSGFIKPDAYEASITTGQFYDEDNGDTPRATAHEWFLQSKRGLLAPFAVGTIDQALYAVLLCRHHFVRLHGLAGKTVVFDEVHAYDAYTGTLLDRLLEYLGALGCTVVLLSATLPSQRRRELLSAFAGRDIAAEANEARYPRLIALGDEWTATSQHLDTSESGQKTITLEWLPCDMEAALEALVARLGERGCAAWVFNTVGDAQEAYCKAKRLMEAGRLDAIHILHSRFTAGERQQREQELVRQFGPGDEGRPAGRVLVLATQVIEQSLDVDFDLMVSDLAPVDLLLQRMGRLHRHRKREGRPGHLSTPCFLLRRACEPEISPPTFGNSVYEKSILMRTLALLQRFNNIAVPGNVEDMIEEVYGAFAPESLDPSWLSTHEMLVKNEQDKRHVKLETAKKHSLLSPSDNLFEEYWEHVPKASAVPTDDDNTADHADMRAMTRLAEESVRVICLFAGRGGKLYFDHALSLPVTSGELPKEALRQLLDQTASLSIFQLGRDGIDEINRRGRKLEVRGLRGALRHLRILAFDNERECEVLAKNRYVVNWSQEVGLQVTRGGRQ